MALILRKQREAAPKVVAGQDRRVRLLARTSFISDIHGDVRRWTSYFEMPKWIRFRLQRRHAMRDFQELGVTLRDCQRLAQAEVIDEERLELAYVEPGRLEALRLSVKSLAAIDEHFADEEEETKEPERPSVPVNEVPGVTPTALRKLRTAGIATTSDLTPEGIEGLTVAQGVKTALLEAIR